MTSVSVLPAVTFTGSTQAPNMGVSGEAGLEMHRASLNAGVLYYVERISFPVLNGASRVDQFSSLRIRLGFQIGH